MFRGVFSAIVTPFDMDGNIDEAALRRNIDFQIENRVSGIVPVGTTGESPTLSHAEHHRVIDIAIDQARGRVQVIAGTGSNSTAEAISLTRHAKEAGADAALIVNPYYNKPMQEGLYQHFRAIADSVDIPIILYNIQGRTGVNVETRTLQRLLADCKNIVAVKEASGNIAQMMDVLAMRPEGFSVLSGDDNLTLPLIACGGDGVISVASNIVPDRIVEMVSLARKGEIAKARELHYELLPLFKALFIETNPVPIKAAMAMKGMIHESYRLPMCAMQEENRSKLHAVLKDLKII